jgi:hypothetical protein
MCGNLRWFALLTCLTALGCDVESTFDLTRASPMPAGLRSDPQVTKAAASATLVQLWLFTWRAELRFYESDELVLVRKGDGYRNAEPNEGGEFHFFVRFNGVESTFRQTILPSILVVEDEEAKSP